MNDNKAVFKIHINGSVEDVWREITKTDEPQQCFFNSVLDTEGLKPGAQIRMRTVSGRHTAVVGEVVEFDPPHRYAHTMRFTQYDDPPCTVTYELIEKDTGVEFVITLDGLQPGTKSAKSMIRGASFIMNTLKSLVEKGKAPLSSRVVFALGGVLEGLSPKSMSSENWPLSRQV